MFKRFSTFFQREASSGIFLLIATVLGLAVGNSGLRAEYDTVLQFNFFGLTTLEWINDGLMTVFFFVVGMEVKQELTKGELATREKALLPFAAALGGMVVPAMIYFYFNPKAPDSNGWGIPMATDIAFAIGVLALFGKRVPGALKVFLVTLAIVDDLGALLVIAFFYSSSISGTALGLAIMLFLAMYLLQKAGVTRKFYYVLIGILAWVAVHKSGVHATVAGVVIGFLTPDDPLEKLVNRLTPWVSFFIVPVFAFANAGIAFDAVEFSSLFSTGVFRGVFFGLLVGKPIGIFAACWFAVKGKIAHLPGRENWGQIFGVGILGGIGFTMSLFIGNLALGADQVVAAKLAILLASVCAGILGILTLQKYLISD